MVKLYKQLMKTSALICLLILGTGNAWGESIWRGYSSSTDKVTTSYKDLTTNLKIKADKQITPGYSKPIKLTNTKNNPNSLYLKPTTNGELILRMACEKSYPFSDENPVAIENITDNTNIGNYAITTEIPDNPSTTGEGEYVSFPVTANKEYKISFQTHSYRKVYLYIAIKIEENDWTLSDENEFSTNKSQIEDHSDKTIVRLNRTLKAGIWNTFCSPITIDTQYLKNFFGDKVYSINSDGYNSDEKNITFYKATSIANGKPYLIKPSKDIVNPVIFNPATNNTGKVKYNPQSISSGKLSFTAVLGATDIYTTGDENSTKFYLNNDGYLVYPTSDTGNNGKIKGFRAYFEWTGGSSGVKDMTFVFDDSETTGIKTIEHDIFGENGRVYSIDGRYMGDSTDNLSRGIYIQNGRKFVVK